MFYILSVDASESCHLFREANTKYVGGFVAVYEGNRDKVIHQVPVVVTKTSLIPIEPQWVNIKINPVLRDLGLNETIQGFLIEVHGPVLGRSGRVPTCRSRFCDSTHLVGVSCPALTSGKTCGHAMTFIISSPQHNIFNVEYTSEDITAVFVAPRVLAVSAKTQHISSRQHNHISFLKP